MIGLGVTLKFLEECGTIIIVRAIIELSRRKKND
jgi:hypothetical protein